MKYAFIDANNLACRVCFSQAELKTTTGISSSLHFGFMSSLISLKQKFPLHQFLISWDGKSKRRVEESEVALKLGIVDETYKACRKKEVMPQPLLDFYEQAPYLKRALEYTGIPQIRLETLETDDIISIYCKNLDSEECVCITTDQDYYQLLNDKVYIYDPMKNKTITETSFKEENGINPKQHIDVGALMGDSSDSICGVPGWGEKTAIKEIKRCGTWENLIFDYQEKNKALLLKYPNYELPPTDKEIEEFVVNVLDAKTKTGKVQYPEVNMQMPYARVLLAFAKEEIKIAKTEIFALMFQERIKLAYSLKKMDDNISDLPDIVQGEVNKERLIEYFNYYEIETLKSELDIF